MKNIFLDTNVLIDFLANREPFAIHAAIIFDQAEKGNVNLYVSAISFNNIYYILSRYDSASAKVAINHHNCIGSTSWKGNIIPRSYRWTPWLPRDYRVIS